MTDLPDHRKFGYTTCMEKRAIADTMISEGMDQNSLEFHFEVNRRWEHSKVGEPTFRERGEKWFNDQKARSKIIPAPIVLSREEVEYMIWKLQGTNDPVGAKLLERLNIWGDPDDQKPIEKD